MSLFKFQALLLVIGLSVFATSYAGDNEQAGTINDLFIDEDTLHFDDEHIELKDTIGLNSEDAIKMFKVRKKSTGKVTRASWA